MQIINILWDSAVTKYFPVTKDDYKEKMIKFGEEWQFPYAFSAADGSHLPIKCRSGGAEAKKQYFNFKGFYSIVLIALVDKYLLIKKSMVSEDLPGISLCFLIKRHHIQSSSDVKN